MPPSIEPYTVPRYERTGFAIPDDVEISELAGYVLLLTGKPHTLTHLLACISTITNNPQDYARIWLELVKLRKHGLIRIYPPEVVPVTKQRTPSPLQWPQFMPRRLTA